MVISNSARTSARRSAKEGASDAPYSIQYTAVPFGSEGWTTTKNVFGRVGRLQTETSPGGRFTCTLYLTPEPNVATAHSRRVVWIIAFIYLLQRYTYSCIHDRVDRVI